MFRQRKTVILNYSWHVVNKCQIAGALIEKIVTKPCNISIDGTLGSHV